MRTSSWLVATCLLFLFSCKKELSPADVPETDRTVNSLQHPPPLKIGDHYAGGIIVYFSNKQRTHGRVCATEDIGNYPWDLTIFDPQHWEDYNPPFLGVTDTVRNQSTANTTSIINALGGGDYAANRCRSYGGGGYSDWSLPTKAELNLIYERIKLPGLSAFPGTYYWSSSEIDNKAVWCQRFDTGEKVNYAWKNNTMSVRPTRAF